MSVHSVVMHSRPLTKRRKPFEGEINLNHNSSLRKVMRAARRGNWAPHEPTLKMLVRHGAFARRLHFALLTQTAAVGRQLTRDELNTITRQHMEAWAK